MNKINERKITKEELIREISNESYTTYVVAKDMYEAFENIIFDYLSSASQDSPVTIKLFEGITLSSNYIPRKETKNNLTGEVIVAKDKIKPKASFTRSYSNKLSSKIK